MRDFQKSGQLPPSLQAQANRGPAALADGLAIFWAGVIAVTPDRLFAAQVRLERDCLVIDDQEFDLRGVRRVVVVGAGKASAAMAQALFESCLAQLEGKLEVVGWINAPEGSFSTGQAGPIHLHAARPMGRNEPTEAAVTGTQEILRHMESCRDDDLCIVLLSGGGSALLTAPVEGITLNDKQQVARKLAAAGANIQQLNTVRRALSRVKGGGLIANCQAREVISLIISDVLGDPLETIASGPTVASAVAQPSEALSILEELGLITEPDLHNVVNNLQRRQQRSHSDILSKNDTRSGVRRSQLLVTHIILGNNATAVDAAGVKAVELGYRYIMQSARALEGDVNQLAERFGHQLVQWSAEPQVDCWISGGEPTVKLPTTCGRGGRNQQLACLTMLELVRRGWPDGASPSLSTPRIRETLLFLSAGTDGEDGPTPAAGAWFDRSTYGQLVARGLDAADYAARADTFSLFSLLDSLIVFGPSGTNVCDLRIALKVKP